MSHLKVWCSFFFLTYFPQLLLLMFQFILIKQKYILMVVSSKVTMDAKPQSRSSPRFQKKAHEYSFFCFVFTYIFQKIVLFLNKLMNTKPQKKTIQTLIRLGIQLVWALRKMSLAQPINMILLSQQKLERHEAFDYCSLAIRSKQKLS